jgi:TolB-like protein/tetratricopeptide (TPR) repeat protein
MERPFPAYKGEQPYIFVSYAHEDAELVYPEIMRLKEQGFEVWYDEGISPGSTWRDEVALALTQCTVFLYYVTPRAVTSSNCLKEVNFCLSRERKILAVHLENTNLPAGLELSLSDMQAIIRNDHSNQDYQNKLFDSLRSLLPSVVEPIPLPANRSVAEPASDEKSIAVLPLENRSNDPDNEYLCDGISEELINGLTRIEGLKVAGRITAFAFKNHDADIKAMGEKLAVQTILSGSVQKSGNRVRISVQLQEVSSGRSIWSERFDGTVDDIFELQDDVAKKVIDALKVELGPRDLATVIDVGTTNIHAYDSYLLGMHEYRKLSRRDLNHAAKHFETACELDPGFASALGQLGWSYQYLNLAFGEEELAEKTQEAFARAEAAGYMHRIYPWPEIKRMINPELMPNERQLAEEACEKIRDPDPAWRFFEYIQLGDRLSRVGLFQAVLQFNELYLAASDYSLGETIQMDRKFMYPLGAAGRYEEAIGKWSRLLELQPDDPIVQGDRALLLVRTGQYSKAEEDLKIINSVWRKNFPQFYSLFWRGDLDAAREYFDWLDSRRNFDNLYRTYGRFMLGDIDKGLDLLEQAPDETTYGVAGSRLRLSWWCPQSVVAEVAQHPRYQELLKERGYDESWQAQLIQMVNQLTDITGIQIQLDSEYWP